MMGDEMAVRSGGMYGNPESQYTLARPSSGFDYGQAFSAAGQIASAGGGIGSAIMKGRQISSNIGSLIAEKNYNIKNYEQRIADTLASNKMSFYASGLDTNSGTPVDVMEQNRLAMEEDLARMAGDYIEKEKNLKRAKRASRLDVISQVGQMGASAAMLVF